MQTPPQNHQVLDHLQVKSRNRNKLITTAPLIDRGLTVEECKTLCTSPLIPAREKVYFRIIYETGLRPIEALNLRIENFNKETGEFECFWATHPKSKMSRSLLRLADSIFFSKNDYTPHPFHFL